MSANPQVEGAFHVQRFLEASAASVHQMITSQTSSASPRLCVRFFPGAYAPRLANRLSFLCVLCVKNFFGGQDVREPAGRRGFPRSKIFGGFRRMRSPNDYFANILRVSASPREFFSGGLRTPARLKITIATNGSGCNTFRAVARMGSGASPPGGLRTPARLSSTVSFVSPLRRRRCRR